MNAYVFVSLNDANKQTNMCCQKGKANWINNKSKEMTNPVKSSNKCNITSLIQRNWNSTGGSG